jgi:hypothetical protein
MDIKLLLEITGSIVALVGLGTAAKALLELRQMNRIAKQKIGVDDAGKAELPVRKAS